MSRRPVPAFALALALLAVGCGGSQPGGRPVTGAAAGGGAGSSPRFVVVTGGAVLDRKTGLTWQRRMPDGAPDFAAAKASCEGLTIDGHAYRLPTLPELQSLVDDRITAPVVDRDAFPDTRIGWFFTGSPYPETKRFVWGVSTETGGLNFLSRSRPALFRCVNASSPASMPKSLTFDDPSPPDAITLPLAPNAVVRETQRSADRITLRITPKGGALPTFQPGQTALVGLPATARRSTFAATETSKPVSGAVLRRRYTIVSAPGDAELELSVRLRAGGGLSPRLHALDPGDAIYLAPEIRGRAVADAFADRNVVLIATGIGIAHFLGFLRSLPATPALCDGPRKIALLQSAPRAADLFYRDELSTLEKACKAFTYIPSVQKPELETPMWAGAKGSVEEVWAKHPLKAVWNADLTPRDTHVSVCANPDVIETMLDTLNADGFSEPLGDRRSDVDICEAD